MAAKNYSRLVRHAGLNQAKYISADTEYELDILTEAQRAKWDEQWEKKKAIENRRIEKAQRMAEIASGVEFAQSETVAAEQIQNKLDSILVDSIDIPAFDIDSLKDRSVFNTTYPLKPVFNIVPQQPNRNDPKYNNKPDLLTKIFKQKLEEFQNKQEKMFQSDLAAWEELSASIQQKNSSLQKQYEQACKVWNDKKALFEKEQAANNEAVDKFKDDFSNGDIAAIERYFTLYLESLNYPFDYNNKVDCEYSKEEKRMIVDCMLPSMEDIPNLMPT